VAVEIRLPQWGMGMAEGTVIGWVKAVGDRVDEGDELVEVESAKATDFVYAPASGVLAAILVPADTTVPVLELLGYIDSSEQEDDDG
jgi:pyruvate/2-oxoglutarate dehydrogenase complex dihydrolipoamide acyltransferase (E2) component